MVGCITNEDERVLTGLKRWELNDQPRSKQNEMARSRDVTNPVTLEQKENEDDKFKAFFNADETARLHVKDSSISSDWKFSVRDTETITDLVNACATMVGENIEVTNLKSTLGINKINDGTLNLITRPLSRGVVADCFRNAQPKSIHAIVGSPGIGKSWSLIHALQQLFCMRTCVSYCAFRNVESDMYA